MILGKTDLKCPKYEYKMYNMGMLIWPVNRSNFARITGSETLTGHPNRANLRGVLEETEDGDEHLDDLEGGELAAGALHVLHAQGDAALKKRCAG